MSVKVISKRRSSGGIRAVIQSLGAKLAIVGVNAATGMLTARLLHPAGRGELAALLLWPQFLSGIGTLGLPSALTYHIRMKPDFTARYLRAGGLIAVMMGLLLAIAGIRVAPTLLKQYSSETIIAARFLIPNTIFSMLLLVCRGALEARGDFGRSNLTLLCPPLLTFVGLMFIQQAGILTPRTAALAYILAGLPALALASYGLPFRGTSVLLPLKQFRKTASELLSYGARSYGNDLCGTLAFYVDQVLVITMLSPASMGYYVVALSLSRILGVVPQAIAMVLFPSLIGLVQSEAIALTGRAIRMSIAISAVPALVLSIIASTALTFFYGHSYSGLSVVLQILIVEALLGGLVTIGAQLYMASNRPGTVTIQQITGLTATLPLLIFLVPQFWVMGAAMAVLLSTSLRLAFMLISFPLVFRENMPPMLPNRDDANWLRTRCRCMIDPQSLAIGSK